MFVRFIRTERHEVSELGLIDWTQQVANEEYAAGTADPIHLLETRCRFGNVVDYAVGNDCPETLGRIVEPFGVCFLKTNGPLESRLTHVLVRQCRHVFREINRHDFDGQSLPAKLDRDLSRACADIDNGIALTPYRQEVRDGSSVHISVIHRVVVARLLERVHDLRFKYTLKHRSTRTEV